jgi:hypothetical protein
MPLFFCSTALLIAIAVVAMVVPTVACAICVGSGNITKSWDNYIVTYHPYRKTLLGDQFKVVPCEECRGRGRLTWIQSKLQGSTQ